jgi:hypothetical protein
VSADRHRGALAALDRILNRGGDADDVLRAVLGVLHGLYPYAGITFVELGDRVPGPSLGTRPDAWETWPISFQGITVAELETAGSTAEDRGFLERVAIVISPYCLVGWDTGGQAWEP